MDGIFVQNIQSLGVNRLLQWMDRCTEYFDTVDDEDVLRAATKTYNALEEELIRRGYYEDE